MRHHNHNRKFGRKKKVRSALLKSLVLSLIVYGRIRTTEAKAKEIRPMVEKMVTRALSADVNARALTQKIEPRIKLITYEEFVQLTVKHNCTQSWY